MEQKDIIVLGVQVGLGILTLLGSGIVSAYVNSRLASYRTDKEFLRTKLETLLTAAFGYHWSAHQVAERLIKGLELTPDRVPEIRSQLLDDFLEISAHYKTVITPEIEASACRRFKIPEWKWEEAKKRFPKLLLKVNQKRLRRMDYILATGKFPPDGWTPPDPKNRSTQNVAPYAQFWKH
jgi:hypothetical protein